MSNKEETKPVLGIKAKAAIARHASDIYARMSGKLPLTEQNAAGNKEQAERAIAQAEYFHEMLAAQGYDGGDR